MNHQLSCEHFFQQLYMYTQLTHQNENILPLKNHRLCNLATYIHFFGPTPWRGFMLCLPWGGQFPIKIPCHSWFRQQLRAQCESRSQKNHHKSGPVEVLKIPIWIFFVTNLRTSQHVVEQGHFIWFLFILGKIIVSTGFETTA